MTHTDPSHIESPLSQTTTLTVWLAELSTYSESLKATLLPMLSTSELKRVGKTTHHLKYREYIVSRALIRHALSEYVNYVDIPWQLTESDNSPPIVTNTPDNISIGLSHSHNLIALTLTHEPIGIDIEYKKPRSNMQAMAASFMTTAEQEHFLAIPSKNQAAFFYHSWCIKEALYKLRSVLNQNTIPIERICTLEQSDQADKIHLNDADLEEYNCKLVVASQLNLTSIEYRSISQFKLA